MDSKSFGFKFGSDSKEAGNITSKPVTSNPFAPKSTTQKVTFSSFFGAGSAIGASSLPPVGNKEKPLASLSTRVSRPVTNEPQEKAFGKDLKIARNPPEDGEGSLVKTRLIRKKPFPNAAPGPFTKRAEPFEGPFSKPPAINRSKFKYVRNAETPDRDSSQSPVSDSGNSAPKTSKNIPFAAMARKQVENAIWKPSFAKQGIKPTPTTMYGKDETDEVARKTEPLPSAMFGLPLATSSTKPFSNPFKTTKLFSNFETSAPPTAAAAPKVVSTLRTRMSPAPRSFSPEPSNVKSQDESKLIRKLMELRGRDCAGDYEKYLVLDERDKLLCQLRETNSQLVSRLERCEEMCTEKERYMRIVQKRASPFECDEETSEVAHDLMVKEYARSAADQERPLPHELRSEKMMNYTMSYLLHTVLDKFPENTDEKASWYNFLWSRTRALRKEVTQLSLSDTLALSLVEKCTRLHILCSYVLCNLGTEHFDKKLNSENLGKCLQTLRHFYEDFERRGIRCENEAEFRAYDVMMHMNDTNVLNQVLSYRDEVRQSKHVCLALELCASFQNNNYIRFFRLLKNQATFLQCCVSHSLFNDVRWSSLHVMTCSYGKTAIYPIYKLSNLLGFDSVEDTSMVLGLYGLSPYLDADQVVLNRDYLTDCEVPMKTYEWIDSKRNGNFSQVVHGPEPFHFYSSRCDVTNSFDANGKYACDTILERVLSSSGSSVVSDSATMSFAQSAGSLAMQATIDQKRKMDQERLKRLELKKRDELINHLQNKIIDSFVENFAAEETMKEKMTRRHRKAQEDAARLRKEQEQKIAEIERRRRAEEMRLAEKLTQQSIDTGTKTVLKTVITNEMNNERKERERKLAENMMKMLWNNQISKGIDRIITGYCSRMMEDKKMIGEGLEKFRRRMKLRWIEQFWSRWRTWATQRREQREMRKERLTKIRPRWDEQELVQKYAASPVENTTSSFLVPNNSIRIKAFQKRRTARISKSAIRKWKQFADEKRETRKIAKAIQMKETQFYARFRGCGDKIQTKFQFEEPADIFEKPRKRKSLELNETTYLEPMRILKPLRPNLSFSVFETIKKETQNDVSLLVARDQLSRNGWQMDIGMPSELKEKLKRRRESMENEKNEQILKRHKEEEEMIEVSQAQNSKMDDLSKETDKLIADANKFATEAREMIEFLKNRRVEDL